MCINIHTHTHEPTYIFIFPTSLCGVLVFCFAPAAPSASASARRVRPPFHHTDHHSSQSTQLTLTPTHHTALSPHHTWLSQSHTFHIQSHPTHHIALSLSLSHPTLHTALSSLSHQLITQHLALTTHGPHLLAELLRAWSPLARGWLPCGRRSTQSLLEELLRAWPRLARAKEPGLRLTAAFRQAPHAGTRLGCSSAWASSPRRMRGLAVTICNN